MAVMTLDVFLAAMTVAGSVARDSGAIRRRDGPSNSRYALCAATAER